MERLKEGRSERGRDGMKKELGMNERGMDRSRDGRIARGKDG